MEHVADDVERPTERPKSHKNVARSFSKAVSIQDHIVASRVTLEIAMRLSRAAPIVAVIVCSANAGCRDAASSPTRPSFGVNAADTIPGGCTDRVCNFNAFGNAAFISWSTPLGGAVASDTGGGGGGGTVQLGNASVSRGGERGAQQTFLSYNVSECTPSFFCFQVAAGFGQIPSEDFDTQGSRYRLTTNTANNPGFFTFAGSPGVITIEWTPNGQFSQSFNGVRRITQPGMSEQQVGKSADESASAAGNVVGFLIGSSDFGQISSSHDVRITITR